jgi:hypothetical protein
MTDTEQELRKCTSCRSTKLLETYFSKNVKGQYYKTCDKCRASSKISRDANKETGAKYYRDNKEHILLKNKQYHEANKEHIRENNLKNYNENKDARRQQKRDYYQQNREIVLKREKAYALKNMDQIKLRKKKYYKDKRHKCEHESNRQTCKVCNPSGHLKELVSSRIRSALKSNKCKGSLEYLGCDIPTFRDHLEKSFKDTMTWENQGEWDIDHIIPVLYKQDGVEPSLEEVGKRLHYTNCQAMWHTENVKKGNRYCGDYHSESD